MLCKNGNEVVILLGSINPFMQTPECLERYRWIMAQAEEKLRMPEVKLVVLPELPSEEYGDSSHPLATGYERLANCLLEKELFSPGE